MIPTLVFNLLWSGLGPGSGRVGLEVSCVRSGADRFTAISGLGSPKSYFSPLQPGQNASGTSQSILHSIGATLVDDRLQVDVLKATCSAHTPLEIAKFAPPQVKVTCTVGGKISSTAGVLSQVNDPNTCI